MSAPAFTPQGKDPKSGEPAWNTADFDSYEHTVETTGRWSIQAPVDRPFVLGRHSEASDGDATTVVTDFGTVDDLVRRVKAAAADAPALHVLIGGTTGRGKTSAAAVAEAVRLAGLQEAQP